MSSDVRKGVIDAAANQWRHATPARIALGRAGNAIPTDESLRFGLAHALARDAVETALDVPLLAQTLQAAGIQTVTVRSEAADRAAYLRRPDRGRRLHAADFAMLRARFTRPVDLCFVVADGLSALAAQGHAVPLLQAVQSLLPTSLSIGPVVIVTQARVALGDDVGEAIGAGMVAMLIGERPGLSSPDSLGVYLTHAPRRGRTDAERNCISNIRPQGLDYPSAAARLAWLVTAARARELTGVGLKDRSERTQRLD